MYPVLLIYTTYDEAEVGYKGTREGVLKNYYDVDSGTI